MREPWSLVDDMFTEDGKVVIENTVRMMQGIHKKLVIEGVETKEAVEALGSLDCDYIQGYYYSRPLSAGDFVRFMEVKEIPHKQAACLAMPFPPCTSCKFLDLPPASLRNLQARLTENSLASQPPLLCGIPLMFLRRADGPRLFRQAS